jgi:purine-binding chemotaxis protein CheW
MTVAVETTGLLVCTLVDERYALPMGIVREVIRWRTPTLVPGTPDTIIGVIHHRGIVLPILDIRPLLGLTTPSNTRSTRLLVTEQDGTHAAVICDAVVDIVEVDAETLEPPPTSLAAAQAGYVNSVFYHQHRPVACIQIAAILATLTAGRHAG